MLPVFLTDFTLDVPCDPGQVSLRFVFCRWNVFNDGLNALLNDFQSSSVVLDVGFSIKTSLRKRPCLPLGPRSLQGLFVHRLRVLVWVLFRTSNDKNEISNYRTKSLLPSIF